MHVCSQCVAYTITDPPSRQEVAKYDCEEHVNKDGEDINPDGEDINPDAMASGDSENDDNDDVPELHDEGDLRNLGSEVSTHAHQKYGSVV